MTRAGLRESAIPNALVSRGSRAGAGPAGGRAAARARGAAAAALAAWRAVAPAAAALAVLLVAVPAEARTISKPASEKSDPIRRGARAADPMAALGKVERRAVAAVDPGVPAALALLERAVNLNSGTMNFDGVRETGRLFEAELAALGFATEWVDGAAWGRAGHLIARRIAGDAAAAKAPARGRPGVRDLGAGAGGADAGAAGRPKVLLIGHLDTVFEKDSPFQRWERLSDSTAKGPGSTDMKGGNVVMLLALRALREAGALDRLDFAVILTGDEEKAGTPLELSRRRLRELADWADVAIGFEDGDGDPRTAVVARRGSSGWRLEVTAKPYHSSQIFREDVGAGAIFEASRLLQAFRDSLAGERLLTYNPGLIVGGTTVTLDSSGSRGTAFGKSNVIAERAIVTGDLRALSGEQLARARATLSRLAASGAPHARASLEFEDGYPPLAPAPGNDRLLAIYDRASRDLGLGGVTPVDPARAGAADISFCDGRVVMAMDGVGLMGEGGHTVDEIADLRTLPTQAKRMVLTLLRLGQAVRRD